MSKFEDLQDMYVKARVTHKESDNNFTLVEVSFKGYRAFGIAKRNASTYPFIPERGYQIARARALKKLDMQIRPDVYATKGERIT